MNIIKSLLHGKVSYARKLTGKGTLYPAVEVFPEIIPMDPDFEDEFLRVVYSIESDVFANPEAFFNGFRRAVNTLGGDYFSKKIDYAVNLIKTDKNDRYAKNVIFSNWVEFGMDVLEKRLKDERIPFGIISGNTSAKERAKLVKDFNETGLNTLIISNAGSTGIDLKGVQRIIVLDPVWNNATLEQIKGRGVRYRSHEHLPLEYRTVKVYLLQLVEGSFLRGETKISKSGDYLLYNIIDKKRNAEKIVSNLLDEINILERYKSSLTPKSPQKSPLKIPTRMPRWISDEMSG